MASVERYRDVKRGDWLIVLGVVLAHVTALVLVSLSTPEVVKTKKSMITVEIGASAPPGAAAPGILQATAESVSAVPGVASAPSPEPQSILKSDPPPMLQSKSQQQTETDTRSQPEPEPDPEPKPEKEPEPEPKSEPVPAPVPAAVPAPKPEPKPEPKPRPRPPVDTPKPSSRPAAPTTAQSGSTTTPGMAGSTAPSVSSAPAGGGGGAVVDADYKAAYLRNPKPPYPPAALKMRVEGTVTLRVLVLEDGTSGKIVLSKSSGNESLDQSALETVAKWKFTPAKSQGQSIAQWVSIPINFSIKRR